MKSSKIFLFAVFILALACLFALGSPKGLEYSGPPCTDDGCIQIGVGGGGGPKIDTPRPDPWYPPPTVNYSTPTPTPTSTPTPVCFTDPSGGGIVCPPPVDPHSVPLMKQRGTTTVVNPPAAFARKVQVDLGNPAMVVKFPAGENIVFNPHLQVVGKQICSTSFGQSDQPNSALRSAQRTYCWNSPAGTSKWKLKLNFRNGAPALLASAAAAGEVSVQSVDDPESVAAQSASSAIFGNMAAGLNSAAAATPAPGPYCDNVPASSCGVDVNTKYIDIIAVFTPELITALGDAEAAARITSSIEDTNQIFCNSGINIRVRLVYSYQGPSELMPLSSTPYPLSTLIQKLNYCVQGSISCDIFPNLADLRAQYEADMVVLFTNGSSAVASTAGSCGASSSLSGVGVLNANPAATPNSVNLASAVVAANSDTAIQPTPAGDPKVGANCCLDGSGNGGSCPSIRHRLAHEVGRLLGLAGVETETTPGFAIPSSARGYFPATNYGTVETDANNILPIFSVNGTPAAACTGVAAWGDVNHNSAGALPVNSATVSAYKGVAGRNVFVVLNPMDPATLDACRCSSPDCSDQTDPLADNAHCWGGVPQPAFGSIGEAAYYSFCGLGNVITREGPNVTAQFPWKWPDCYRSTGGPASTENPAQDQHDLILVGPGIYKENIGIAASSMIVQSINGPGATIIEPGPDGPPGERMPFAYYTPVSTTARWTGRQQRVFGNPTSGTEIGVLFRGFEHDFAPAAPAPTPTPVNLIISNKSVYRPTLDGFTIRNGFAGRVSPAVWAMSEVAPIVRNNVITNNVSWSGLGAGMTFEGSGGLIENNVIYNNTIGQLTRYACIPDIVAEYTSYTRNWNGPGLDYKYSYRTMQYGPWNESYPCHPALNAGSGYGPSTDSIIGGAGIFVSPVCRYFSNKTNFNPGLYWGYDESWTHFAMCPTNAVTATLQISNNLIYGNSYENSNYLNASSTKKAFGRVGAGVLIAAPEATFSSIAPSSFASFQVNMYHNTISDNVYGPVLSDPLSTASGSGLACSTTALKPASFKNNIVTGGYFDRSGTPTGDTSPYVCGVMDTNNAALSWADRGNIFDVTRTIDDPSKKALTTFKYQLKDGGTDKAYNGACNNKAVDQGICLNPAIWYDAAGNARVWDTGIVPGLGYACGYPDFGALEKQSTPTTTCP